MNPDKYLKSDNRINKPNRTIAAAIVLFIISALLAGCGSSVSPKDILAGVTFIRSLEEKDVQSIEKSVFEVKRAELLKEAEAKVEADPDYVWTALNDIGFVIMGDSRAVAFGTYGFMDERHVLAEGGKRCSEVETHFEELKIANPKIVVLAYGLNDIGWGFDEPSDFAEYMCSVIDIIQDLLPDAYIYLQSILPPNENGIKQAEVYGLAREWNEGIKEYVESHGYRYLDIEWLADEYGDEYFGEDGVHFYAGFYKYWALEILKRYLYDSAEEEV